MGHGSVRLRIFEGNPNLLLYLKVTVIATIYILLTHDPKSKPKRRDIEKKVLFISKLRFNIVHVDI